MSDIKTEWVIKSPGQGKPYRMAHVAMDANRHLCGAACGNVVLIEAPAGFAKCPACKWALERPKT
jgi:hypothetical protein